MKIPASYRDPLIFLAVVGLIVVAAVAIPLQAVHFISVPFALAGILVPPYVTYRLYGAPRDPSVPAEVSPAASVAIWLVSVLFFGLMMANLGSMGIPFIAEFGSAVACPEGFRALSAQASARQWDLPNVVITISNEVSCKGELGTLEPGKEIFILGVMYLHLIYSALYLGVVLGLRGLNYLKLDRRVAHGLGVVLFAVIVSFTLLNPPVRAAVSRPLNSLVYRGHAASLVGAVKRHKLDMIRDLLARGGDINAKNDHGETALSVAQRYQDREALSLFEGQITGGSDAKQALLDRGIIYGPDSFVEQLERGNVENVKLFLDSGMEINELVDYVKGTPLSIAAAAGHKDLVQFLINRKADVNKPSKVGWTPLFSAAITSARTSPPIPCHDDIVLLLLQNGAQVNAATNDGDTPLMSATKVLCPAAVKTLVAHKADVNARTTVGYSALQYAVELTGYHSERHPTKQYQIDVLNQDSYELVKYLLEQGADPSVNIYSGTLEGQTPLRTARGSRVKEVVELLERYHARE